MVQKTRPENDAMLAEYPDGEGIQTLFEEQVRRTPQAIAIVYEEEQLTYDELNRRANQLAHFLRQLGVGTEVHVGLCMARSLKMVIALLAILKAGGAYVPLDPTYPAERMRFLLDDADVAVLITQSALLERLPAALRDNADDVGKPFVLCLDRAEELFAHERPINVHSDVQPGNLAYIIYTSGSTGKPKGVGVCHRQVMRLFTVTQPWYSFDLHDCWTLFHSIAFDFSVWEIWGALLYGGRLLVVPYWVSRSPEEFAALLVREQVTILNQTPSAFYALQSATAERERENEFALRLLIFGGESLDSKRLQGWLDRFGDSRPQLVNMYGITETTVHVTYSPVSKASIKRNGSASIIGRPLPDLQLYVLDSRMDLVPPGVEGEAYVGGAGLARGYVGRADLTAERFVPHPFSVRPGARLYRTGDVMRYQADGTLEYVGRADQQVKVRGFRIEPGEIEAALRQQPGVEDGIVVLREDISSDKRLVAYVVLQREQQPTGEDVGEMPLPDAQVAYWQQVFDETYRHPFPAQPTQLTQEPLLNIVGWNSSYTNTPIPTVEMRDWVDHTSRRILDMQPRCVLEIGCGTGLLLLRIAPACLSYTGTDFSPTVLHGLEQQLRNAGDTFSHVQLLQREADDFTGLAAEMFDTVIINSVIQYFPNVQYLQHVLEGALRVVKPGGTVFIGDVRSLPLLEAFHTSVALHSASDALPTEQLRQRIQQHIAQESELVVDPALFYALERHYPRISSVEVQLKRGRFHNEMTCFRYDALLTVAAAAPPSSNEQSKHLSLDWQKEALTVATIRQLLQMSQPEVLTVSGVPNARLTMEAQACTLLNRDDCPATVGEVRLVQQEYAVNSAVDPEDLWELLEDFPYDVTLLWTTVDMEGEYQAVFQRRTATTEEREAVRPPSATLEIQNERTLRVLSWQSYANNPLRNQQVHRQITTLRTALKQQLPDYMVPAAILVLDTLPLTANGKVNHRALPTPQWSDFESEENYEAPRTPLEEQIAIIWQEVLHLERVGVRDNFFSLGGHSLLAARLVSRLQKVFQVSVPLRTLFEAPSVVALAQYLQQASTPLLSPITPVAHVGMIPASFAQERLWFLDQLEMGSAFNNVLTALRLRKSLHVALLRRGLDEMIRRHEALRTSFVSTATTDGRPMQIIAASFPLALPLIDLSMLVEQGQEVALQDWAMQEAQSPFDVSKGPLLRATLFRLGNEDFMLVVAMHHIITDGWSQTIFLRELARLYDAFADGQPSPLSALPVQYADYAVWQRHWLQGAVLEHLLAYWRTRLAGVPPVLQLPTDHIRPAVQSHRGSRLPFALSPDLRQQLHALSRQEGVTLYMTLLASFQTLLWRYTGQEDVVVGTPVAGRTAAEVEGLIGFFVNTLVMRTDLSGDPAFRELLRRVQTIALGAFTHQELPFERVVEELRPQRCLSYAPLVQVIFALENVLLEGGELSALGLELLDLDTGMTRFDLALLVWESEGTLVGVCEYSTDLFERTTIERMVEHWQTLLAAIVAHPERRLSQLSWFREVERSQLLSEWNATQTPYPVSKCIHQLFEERVAQVPAAIALVMDDMQLTYAELNQRSNQLAHYLQKCGVGPEVLVGVCLERSLEVVIAILGILKAGGAYVPLDPSYPLERLALLLHDTQVPVLVTHKDLEQAIRASLLLSANKPLAGALEHVAHTVQVIWLDEAWLTIARERTDTPNSGVRAENLAYVIYTSGSTGRPKGVCIQHGGVCNLAEAQRQLFQVQAGERVLQFATVTFDASVSEIFVTLWAGATLALTTKEMAQSPEDLAAFLHMQSITSVTLPPTMLTQLPAEHLPGVHTVISAGEACSAELVTLWSVGRTFINAYGPTEATVCAVVATCVGDEGKPPLGRPIANAQIYILDGNGQPVPIGVPGELYIGGVGVARGYLNQPELTAEKFMSAAFSQQEGTRLYRSGDRARYLADGNIEFLGRTDQQIKLRGYRIELEEIEVVLMQHPAVREALAMVREDVPGDQRLVAYVVPLHHPPDARPHKMNQELRQALQDRLPSYMVPAAFMLLPAFPLLPNGKVDRHAFPPPQWHDFAHEQSFESPRTPREEQVAAIWREVLHLERVGRHDNFFALGGHSLLATQVLSRIRATFGVVISLRTFFAQPSVAALVGYLQPNGQRALETSAEAVFHIPVRAPSSSFPLSFAQQRVWFLDQLEPGNASYAITTAFRLRGDLHVEALAQSFNLVVQRHESLRTTFVVVQGRPMQVIAATAHIPLPLLDLCGLDAGAREAEVQRHVAREARHSFTLARGPLVRVLLLRLAERDHVVLLNIHHIVSDGWSTMLLIQEVATLYTALHAGEPSPLPDVPIQYADYAVWQRTWLQGEVLERQLAYWRQQLAHAPAVLELPTDRLRPALQTYEGGTVSLLLPQRVAEQLREVSQKEQVTLYMTLLAIFQLLLYRHTGQEDMVIGTPIAHRNRADIEGLIGFFVNTLVLRTDLSGEPSFRELLGRVREVALGAYTHQDVPFDRLVEELSPERRLSHTPLIQVCFNMVNLPTQQREWSGLTVESFWPHEAGAKFDLTLYAYDLDEGIRLELVYNTQLFDEARMRAMLQQFAYLAGQVSQSEEKIVRFSLLPPPARAIVPDPTVPLSATWEGSIQQLFSQTAVRLAEHVAVVDSAETITYRELDRRSNQLANYLRTHGIASGDTVAVYSQRSATLVWAIQGILKAGAAYILLDPAYPVARLIDYLAFVNVRGWLHITAAGTLPQAMEEYLTTTACCCRLELSASTVAVGGELATYSPADPGVAVGPDDLACVTFTSGSTGKPKGILQRHGPLSHFLPWQRDRFGLTKTDRYSMLSGLAHDPLQREIFPPLCLGGTIVIPAPEHLASPGWLAQWMRQEQITIAQLTPAMLHLLTLFPATGSEHGSARSEISSLRYAFIGGEVVTTHDILRLKALAPAVTCVNFYGSAETHRALGYYVVPSSVEQASIPLGQGFQDVQLLVLNTAQELAGIGELGEIYVRSPHLARGYVGDEAVTATRFLLNPFTKREGDRMYRTGDWGRYLPDGNVAYAGRRDQQVKLRGFRIELAEIEAMLGLHAAVQEAVVVLREDIPGNKRLVAYIVPAQPLLLHTMSQELHDFLAVRLPASMIPATFVTLGVMPLTPNGKIDRRALPLPESLVSTSETIGDPRDRQNPRTPIEEILSVIWAKVLGRDYSGIHENFFVCGGHSLLATQLLARVSAIFQQEVPLRVLFETPTVAGLATFLEQQLVLAPSSSDAQEKGAQRPSLVSQAREAGRALFPASFAQERLWFLDQYEPGNTAYNLQVTFRVSGKVRLDALQESISVLVQRHETLRTSFVTIEGRPMQAIDSDSDLPFALVDLGDLSADMQEVQVQYSAQCAVQRPFDLERGPLFAFTLLRLNPAAHVLVFTVHHTIFDAWSAEVLFRELDVLYTAYSASRPSSLPAPRVQYADYAVWQRDWLQGDVLSRQMAYWKTHLEDAPTILDVPTDHPRPLLQTFHGTRYSFTLPAPLTTALTLLSRQKGVTLYMTLLAAFQVLLFRYSGQEDLTIGTPIAGRMAVELEGLIGFFVNTLVMRGDLSGSPTFEEFLERVRAVTLDAYAHQEVPFEKLVEALQPERSLSHSPLFQVLFVLQNAPTPPLRLADLTLEPLEVPRVLAKFDLALMLWQEGEELSGTFEYNTDLFEATTIQRMVGHLHTLLEGIVAHPDWRLSHFPLLTAEERQHVLIECNATHIAYPQESSIHSLFEAQVGRTPDTVALSFEGEQLTYEALNQCANQLARYLRRRANMALALVGLCIDRSLDMVVGLLGILKAGAAYVPLDPDYPVERLAFMMHDADIALLLTQRHVLLRLASHTVPVVCLDSECEVIARESAENLASSVTAQHLAYVIYTSGSTGTPKGVQIAHMSVVNFLTTMRRQPGLSQQDVMLALTSLSFDIAGLEIFLPLLIGARIEVASHEVATDGIQLRKRLTTAGITVLQATPTTWGILLKAGWPGNAGMTLLCGGEALPPTLAAQLLTRGASLWNMYGPTETTIWSTVHPVIGVQGSIPIGRPIANTQVYLLDAHLEPVPGGVPGELYIGGVGLSQGYLGRPDVTAERFVPHPFSPVAGTRLYKTGDLARYQLDGTLEFLGRNDSQVKLRGFRIELQEIEAVLSQHPLIKEAVVLLREDEETGGTERQIVAYIVPQEESQEGTRESVLTGGRRERLKNQELRQYLQDRLPIYMLPATFVWLTELPHTPNGKLDRRALPAPAQGLYEKEHIHEEQYTFLEDLLMQLWRQVLRRADVGLHDNFFALGGHSLLATQLMSRVRTACQVELPLRSLFATPTVAGLAHQIETLQREAQELLMPPLVALSRTGDDWQGTVGAMPLSFAQQRLWFLNQWDSDSSLYTMSIVAQFSGKLDIQSLERSLNALVQRHEVLRTTYLLHEGQPVQVIAPGYNESRFIIPQMHGPSVPLEVVDAQELPSNEQAPYVQHVCVEAFQRPFDLSEGPLLRALLVRLTEVEHVFLLTIHHIIFDDWSKGILLRELAVFYEAFTTGSLPILAELPVQYADFAAWQRQWLQGAVLEHHLAYWKSQLVAAPAVLELPTDHPRPSVQTTRGAHHFFALPAPLTRQLQMLSQQEGVTLFMTLLAAFQVLLLRYSGQEDLVIGTPLAQRTQVELEDLIGCFINTLVLRTDLSGNPTFRVLLNRVLEVVLRAHTHQDMPFEQLVEALQVERSLSHTPLFQVMFVWQQNSEEAWNLPGLTRRSLDIESGTAKFDLTLFLWEQANQLNGVVEYRTDLFEAPTIERLVMHYHHLLQGIVTAPEQTLARLPLLSEAERQHLLGTWNDTQTHSSMPPNVVECFVQQVARTPDALALSCEDEQLTYQEVQARVRQLAHLLRLQGVEPEVLVALLAERGLSFVIAVLAILQAGGAYLPLDPQHPATRLRQVLEQSGVRHVLTTATLASHVQQALDELTAEQRPHVLALESLLAVKAEEEMHPLGNYVSSRQLSYVIYTSGSTGLPKGAMIEQAGMLNHLQAKIADLQLTANDVVAQTASQCFDISVWQLVAALLVGGRVQILPDTVAHDPSRLLQEAQQRGITILETVPSLLHALVAVSDTEEVRRPAVTSLRWLIPTGEALPPTLCRRWLQHYPHIPLLNAYGPTECSDDVTHYAVIEPPPVSVSYMPIGKPVANTQLYVLDRWGEMVPPGAFGELYVGGQGVGRGYLGDVARTAAVFVPDHMSGEAGARLYKTGDVVRYLPDGCLEYRDRVDQQVKLRGYRIELGDIQAVLYRYPRIREAAVLLREDEGIDKRLVAYVVAQTEAVEKGPVEELSGPHLRQYLQEYLPAYMLPAAFVLLERLPRTANGKLDRRALPPPSRGEASVEAQLIAPITPVETQLAQLWAQVLRMEQVGIYENFFALGGHSLLAIQLLGRVRDTFGVALALRSLFEAPTISAMAQAIEQQQHGQADESIAVIGRTESSNEEILLGRLDQLSDEEMEALLDAVLAEEENDG